MKKLFTLLLAAVVATPAMAQPPAQVTVSFGTPYSAGPSETEDGWWVPILVYNPQQVQFKAFWTASPGAPHRNIHFGGNIKPVMTCSDPEWLPGTQVLCGGSIVDGHYLDGDYFPPGQYSPWHTAGGFSPESYDDPDSAYMSFTFQHNHNIGEQWECVGPFPVSGTAMTIRVVKRYNTPEYGTITIAPTIPGPNSYFSSQWIDCAGANHFVAVGYPLTLPPPGSPPGGGGGGGGHEEGVVAGEGTAPKAQKAAVKRSTWGQVKSFYR